MTLSLVKNVLGFKGTRSSITNTAWICVCQNLALEGSANYMCKPICFAIENLANFSHPIRTVVPALVVFDTLDRERKRHISLSPLALFNELI